MTEHTYRKKPITVEARQVVFDSVPAVYPCKPDVFEATYEPVAVIDCPDHRPVQHRDGKPPWCKTCGLTAYGVEPVGLFDRETRR